jgi:hypothetical protein
MMFKKFFGHLKTVLTHKRWVYYYMSRLGYPWRGLMHDMSKFSPEEFFDSVKYWDGKRSPVLVAKERTGISMSWLHHRGRNKHHYEYWIDKLDQGGVPHKIPFKYVVEMVCDWLAACRTYEGQTENIFEKEYNWWCNKSKEAKIHNETKQLLHRLLWNLAEHQRSRNGDEKQALEDVYRLLPGMKTGYETGFIDDRYDLL